MPEITTTGGTSHAELDAWVKEVAAHTKPDQIVWIAGSDEELERINATLVEAGTFTKLADDKKPNSYHALSDPQDAPTRLSLTLCTLHLRRLSVLKDGLS